MASRSTFPAASRSSRAARAASAAPTLALARAGADVVIADIQVESDESTRPSRTACSRRWRRRRGSSTPRGDGAGDPGHGARAPRSCDVTDREQVASTVDRVVEEFGSVDILINNAGTLDHVSQFTDQNPDLWDATSGST